MWNNTGSFGGDFDGGYGNNANAGGAAGGFMNSPGKFDSPSAGGAAKKERRNQNIVSVCVRSVLEADAESFTIEGMEVNMVQLCGIIRSVEVASSKTTYSLDDHTGVIQVLRYPEDGEDGSEMEALAEGQYARIVGPVRTFQGNKHILSFNVVQIEDPNFITTHILEVIHQRMKLKQLSSSGDQGSSIMGGSNALLANSTLQQNAPSAAGSSDVDLISNAIRSFNSESGVTKAMITQSLKGKMTAEAIDNTVDHLLNEGMIYTTHDEDHFMVIDA